MTTTTTNLSVNPADLTDAERIALAEASASRRQASRRMTDRSIPLAERFAASNAAADRWNEILGAAADRIAAEKEARRLAALPTVSADRLAAIAARRAAR